MKHLSYCLSLLNILFACTGLFAQSGVHNISTEAAILGTYNIKFEHLSDKAYSEKEVLIPHGKKFKVTKIENVDIFTEGKVGMAMGNYFFTTPEGDEVKVEYSFGYVFDDEGAVRINLHHSSMPYAG